MANWWGRNRALVLVAVLWWVGLMADARAHYFRFTKQTSTGVQTITGVPFTGKALIIWSSRRTVAGVGDGAQMLFGMTDGTDQMCRFACHPDNEATTTSGQSEITNRIVHMTNATTGAAPTVQVEGDFAGFTDSGFTIDWLTNDSDATIFHAIVFGGSDLQIDYAPTKITGATVTVTTGFEPDSFIVIGGAADQWGSGDYNTGAPFGSIHGFGFSNASENVCGWTLGRGTGGAADTYKGQRTNRVFDVRVANLSGAGVICGGRITATSATGYTVTRDEQGFGAQPVQHIIAIKGIQAAIGTVSSPASPGDEELELGFRPSVLLTQTHGSSTLNSVLSGMSLAIGAWSESASGGMWLGGTDNANPSVYASSHYVDTVLEHRQEAATGSASTVDLSVTVSATTSSGATLTFGTVPGSPFELLYIAFGSVTTCYGGGGVDLVADPAAGETFTGRQFGPRAWATFGFDDEDRSFALDRYNHIPSYYGGLKRGQVLRYGAITRQLSDRFSSYKMADVSVDMDDTNRLLSTLEATSDSEHWYNREVRLYCASVETIAAQGTPHVLFRGIWTGYRSRGLVSSLAASDYLGSNFSDLNLERTIPGELIGVSFTAATEEMQARVVPIAMGKWVDTIGISGDPVTGVGAVAVAQAPAAPSGFTATFGSGGALFDPGDFRNIPNGTRVYYALGAVVGGVESQLAYADDLTTESDGSIALAASTYSGATELRLYVSFRSDFLQYATAIIAGDTLSVTDKTAGTRFDVNVLDIWAIGLRMNVYYLVWAKLAGGGLSNPNGLASTPMVMFTPVSMGRDRTADVSWDAYPDAIGYVVVRRRDYYNGWGRIHDKRWDLGAGVTTLTDVMTNEETPVALPSVPSGCLPLLDVGHTTTIGGTRARGLLLCKGAIQHVEEVYISRATIGGAAYSDVDAETFDLVPESAYGVSWWAPGKPGWEDVSATNYIDVGGKWYTLVFTSQEPLPLSVRCNACTRTDQPGGTGSVITGACRQVFHLLNQEIMPPAEEVWTAGDYLPPRAFDDGTPIVNSSSVIDAEVIEAARLSDLATDALPLSDGYQGQLYFGDPISVRELLAQLSASFDLRFGQNEHGQFIFQHLNEFVDLDTCRSVTDAQEIQIDTEIDRRLAELENKVTYDWGHRPADNSFDFPGHSVQDDTAITANRGRLAEGDRLQFLCTRDAATVQSVTGWRLAFGKYPPRYVTMRGPIHWLNIKLGDVIKATDAEGIGATGWVERPLWVVGHVVELNDLQEPITVELTCIDVQRFLSSFGVWASDGGADWASSSDEDRATYMFWSNDDGEMPDGSDGKDWS